MMRIPLNPGALAKLGRIRTQYLDTLDTVVHAVHRGPVDMANVSIDWTAGALVIAAGAQEDGGSNAGQTPDNLQGRSESL